jgi:hypothetical protein
MSPGAEKLSTTLQDQYTLAIQELRKSGLTKITEEDVSAQVNKQLMGYTETLSKGKVKVHEGLIKQMALNAEQDFGNSKNIFRAPAPEVIAQANPSLAADPAWEQIAKRAALVNPNPKFDDMRNQAWMSVVEGKLKPEEAAKFISSYYKQAMVVNSVNERFSRYAIPEDFNTSYRVATKNSGVIDASNEAQVLHSLTKFIGSYRSN